MHEILEQLLANGPVVTDGAWGTQMQERGLPIGACPDAWNLTHPDRVEAVARAYAEAGSKVILTNTFGSTRIALDRHGLAGQAAAINRAGASISRRAAGTSVRVFGSMGPSGKMLITGEVTENELLSGFREQASALAEGGADGLIVETMADLGEAVLAISAARDTGLPVVVCMVFDTGKNSDRTMMGVTPEKAAAELASAGADVIGANCGIGAAVMRPTVERLRASTALPLWIKPNAGLPQVVDGRAVYSVKPEEFAADAVALVKAGASFIGGCCGTSPAYIRALADALRGPY